MPRIASFVRRLRRFAAGWSCRLEAKGARRGQTLGIFLVFLGVLLGMTAGSVTVGTLYVARTRLQNAVDAAALAGAQALATGDPNAPQDQAALIPTDDPGASGTVTADDSRPRTVIATGTVQVPGGFAALFGWRTFTVAARAVATYNAGAAFTYAIFQADLTRPLNLTGNFDIQGNVHANDCIEAQGHVQFAPTDVLTASQNDPSACNVAAVMVPPLSLPVWTLAQLEAAPDTTVVTPQQPDGWQYDPTSNTFSPPNELEGNYVVEGNVTLNGGATIQGSLVVWGGNLTVDGGVTATGILAAIGNGATLTVNGGGHTIEAQGIFYDPRGEIVINGEASFSQSEIVGQDISAQGGFTLTAPPADQVSVPVWQVSLVQ
jgi:Flp pilus assembly protein TadG